MGVEYDDLLKAANNSALEAEKVLEVFEGTWDEIGNLAKDMPMYFSDYQTNFDSFQIKAMQPAYSLGGRLFVNPKIMVPAFALGTTVVGSIKGGSALKGAAMALTKMCIRDRI